MISLEHPTDAFSDVRVTTVVQNADGTVDRIDLNGGVDAAAAREVGLCPPAAAQPH